MAKSGPGLILVFLFAVTLAVEFDDLDAEMDQQRMMKIIRAAVNQTKADTLNLPSNATTIRENITDTFSCEGLPYGYYADMDNDCQIFHVCLPSLTTSGRNTTYRWSFICPGETVFNQEVLVCTRPRDAIDCADSPMYYDKNMDIGKIDSDAEMQSSDMNANPQTEQVNNPSKTRKNNRKPGLKKKQNIVKDISRMKWEANDSIKKGDNFRIMNNFNNKDALLEIINKKDLLGLDADETEIIAAERNFKRNSKALKKRGVFRFKADAI